MCLVIKKYKDPISNLPDEIVDYIYEFVGDKEKKKEHSARLNLNEFFEFEKKKLPLYKYSFYGNHTSQDMDEIMTRGYCDDYIINEKLFSYSSLHKKSNYSFSDLYLYGLHNYTDQKGKTERETRMIEFEYSLTALDYEVLNWMCEEWRNEKPIVQANLIKMYHTLSLKEKVLVFKKYFHRKCKYHIARGEWISLCDIRRNCYIKNKVMINCKEWVVAIQNDDMMNWDNEDKYILDTIHSKAQHRQATMNMSHSIKERVEDMEKYKNMKPKYKVFKKEYKYGIKGLYEYYNQCCWMATYKK